MPPGCSLITTLRIKRSVASPTMLARMFSLPLRLEVQVLGSLLFLVVLEEFNVPLELFLPRLLVDSFEAHTPKDKSWWDAVPQNHASYAKNPLDALLPPSLKIFTVSGPPTPIQAVLMQNYPPKIWRWVFYKCGSPFRSLGRRRMKVRD